MTETRARIETLEDALAAVAKVGPVAREHAQKCEDGRRLAPEVIDAIADAGLWRAFGPKAVGDAFSFHALPIVFGGLALIVLIGFGIRTGIRRLGSAA